MRNKEHTYLLTYFVTWSCGVHAVCNIGVAMNRELARCEYMLAPLSHAERQEITLGSLDNLLSQPATDDDVTHSVLNFVLTPL